MDSSVFSKKGSSDPYVKFFVRDSHSGKVSVVGKTKTIKKNLSPNWNSHHSFLMTKNMSSTVILQVRERERGRERERECVCVFDTLSEASSAANSAAVSYTKSTAV